MYETPSTRIGRKDYELVCITINVIEEKEEPKRMVWSVMWKREKLVGSLKKS